MFAARNVAAIRPGPRLRPATKKSLLPLTCRLIHKPQAIMTSVYPRMITSEMFMRRREYSTSTDRGNSVPVENAGRDAPRGASGCYCNRVASAFVPAAHVTPPEFEYIARSTTIWIGEAPMLSTIIP